MKVIFLEDVAGTADAGEVKVVKNGFARNFLLPRKLAAPATRDQLQRVRAIEKNAHEQRLKHSQEWDVVAKAIDGMIIPIEVRVGPSGRLFGAVTGRQIAEKLSEATERDIDHRQVLLGAAIHDPGDYPVTVRLYREVTAGITVSVIPEGYEPGTEPTAEAEAFLEEEAQARAAAEGSAEETPEAAEAETPSEESEPEPEPEAEEVAEEAAEESTEEE